MQKIDYPLYYYPHGSPDIFVSMTKLFLRNDYKYAWCLWRKQLSDTSAEFHQVAGDHYVLRDKRQLQQEILDSFQSHPINYIMPSVNLRIYMSFENWDEATPYFRFMMDGLSVAWKYKLDEFDDAWGILR